MVELYEREVRVKSLFYLVKKRMRQKKKRANVGEVKYKIRILMSLLLMPSTYNGFIYAQWFSLFLHAAVFKVAHK